MRNENSRGNEYCPIDDGTVGHSTGHENSPDATITAKTHPCRTVGARTRDRTLPARPSEQFPAERPKGPATAHEEIIVAGDDAVLLTPTGGER